MHGKKETSEHKDGARIKSVSRVSGSVRRMEQRMSGHHTGSPTDLGCRHDRDGFEVVDFPRHFHKIQIDNDKATPGNALAEVR